MKQNKFYIILGRRGNGRISAQCEYFERAYEKLCKEHEQIKDIKKYLTNYVVMGDELKKFYKY